MASVVDEVPNPLDGQRVELVTGPTPRVNPLPTRERAVPPGQRIAAGPLGQFGNAGAALPLHDDTCIRGRTGRT